MSTFVITKGRGTTPLNNIWDGEFCDGLKCIEVSNDCYTIFQSENNAREYLNRKLELLEEWINKDIPNQAKKWAEHNRQEFLDKNLEIYKKLKKAISNMKIVQN